MVTDLNNKVNELSQQVEKQQEMIEKQNDIIKTLSENAGVGDSSGIEVLDWDATTPEVDTAP
jgi:TolA-binding protein